MTMPFQTTPTPRLSDLLAGYARTTPARSALIFLENGEGPGIEVDYQTLHRRAAAFGAELVGRGLHGERVLLLLPSGVEYVVAVLGCVYAGVIAVPIFPPRNNWHAERVGIIARDAGARATLTLGSLRDEVRTRLEAVGCEAAGEIVAVDEVDFDQPGFVDESITPDRLAYLQYTSGSTGNPKGVMVRHGDLVGNCSLYAGALGLREGDTLVSWLPIFHDMGLVQGIVLPLTLGGTSVFMPPAAFVQKPVRWLRALGRYRAAFSGGPNFAYELCANKVTDEEAAELDLSSVRGLLNAAEPISPLTVRKFAGKFAASGLRRGALLGGFGLAEATLYVTCGRSEEGVPALWLAKSALEQGRVEVAEAGARGSQELVGCGRLGADPEVRIVDPATGLPAAPATVGEIWVSGSTVCGGYWKLAEATEETFGGTLADRPGRRYMRTGDLGFVHEGELYITGRLKDLIIIRGANHYPQDIERTAEAAHPSLRRGGWAASFTLDGDAEEPRLVVVHEVERTARKKVDPAEVGLAVMRAVTEQHGIDVDLVVLVEPGGVPKTSSGKIQRKACRQLLLAGELSEVGRWERHRGGAGAAARPAVALERPAIEAMLRDLVARMGGIAPERVSVHQPFSALGLNSVKLVELIGELGESLGIALSPTVAFEYPTIESLAGYLGGYLGGPAAEAAPEAGYEPVAIVGLGCRFPGADTPEQYWELLSEGRSAVGEIPAERVALTGYSAGPDDPFRFGGFLRDVDAFDAGLFGISPREAESIDPQQRLLLETTWHALESARIPADRLVGSATGVFVGISSNDYFRLQRAAGAGRDAYSGTGSALSIAANRISYSLGLQGPSMALDTACSSSLVAVHQACRALAAGECELALAGGVNLVLSPEYGVIFGQAQMLSPTGRCHTFSDDADGYVRGEGCGVVVLKRLRDAQRDGDTVLAVIRGSAVNQDGPSNGLTAPNGRAQQQVIRSALRRAGLNPGDIGYVETHGTGTPLGDPIEVESLRGVLDAPAADAGACWIGAVKPNIGHLESAAGIAGLIKTVLVLERGQIPPVAERGEQNRHIDLSGSRLRIAREPVEWRSAAHAPRRAGVSSFGFGGTNAHLIVEEAPAAPAQAAAEGAEGPFLLVLSAGSPASLRGLARRYARLVESTPAAELAGVCRAANSRRARLAERLAVVGATPAELASALARFADDPQAQVPGASRGRARQRSRLALLFTGQGSQYAGMGSELYRAVPAFREYIDRCDAVLTPLLGRSLPSLLWGEDAALLDDTRYAQPALVALELALAHVWRQHGVEPELVAGHSVGEYAAACVAGLFDLETTLRLVAERGRLMASAPGRGTMLSVAAEEAAAAEILAAAGSRLEVAAVNAPGQVVLSGDVEEVAAAEALFAARGIETTRLNVSHAFHSRLMEPALPELREALAAATIHPATRRLVTTGGGTDGRPEEAGYWVEQLRRPVRFADAVVALTAQGADTFLEAGPAPVLSRLGARTVEGYPWLPSMKKGADEHRQLLETLGALFVQGVDVRFERPGAGAPAPTVALPAYVFDRARHWFAADPSAAARPAAAEDAGRGALPGRRIDLALDGVAAFEAVLPGEGSAYLEDHRIRGQVVMPGAGYAALVLEAARAAGIAAAGESVSVRALEFVRPLELGRAGTRVQTVLQRGAGEWTARVVARDEEGDGWVTYAAATLSAAPAARARQGAAAAGAPRDVAAFYAYWAEQGLEYGPAFRAARSLVLDGDRAVARLELAPGTAGADALLHPALLDSAFQAVGPLLERYGRPGGFVPLPVRVDRLVVHAPAGERVSAEVRLRTEPTGREIVADLALYDERGESVAEVSGLHLALVSPDSLLGSAAAAPQHLEVEWVEATDAAAAPAAARPWLLLDEAGSGDALRHHGVPVRTLAAGGEMDVAAAVRRAAADLAGAEGIALSLRPDEADGDPAARTVAVCRQTQDLLAALGEAPALRPGFRVSVLARGAASLPGDAGESLSQAALAAMLRSAALEYPALALSLVDLPAAPTGADWRAAAAALAAGEETQVAVRDGVALAPRVRPLPAPSGSAAPAVRRDGTYLVTGGTGGIGLALADWLARAGAGRIVLASRRAAADERVSSLVESCRARGVEVVLRRADVGREEEVAALVEELTRASLPLRGVFHAAGVLRDRPLAEIDAAAWREVVDGKARAAWLLDRHTRGVALDHFVLFSSIAATFGSAGQGNYAAANGFLDALAARRRREGRAALCVDWGPWAEVGMASDAGVIERLASQGLLPMKPSAALAALGAAMAAGRPRTAVAAVDWSRFAAGIGARVPSVLREVVGARGAAQADALLPVEELVALDGAAATRAVRLALAALLRQVLRVEGGPLAPGSDPRDVRLSSLGVDSLMAMELRNRVRAWANVDLPAHLLIGNSSVEEVADLVYQKVLLGSLSAVTSESEIPADETEVFVL